VKAGDSCPNGCGGKMAVRVRKKDSKFFLGCTNFPKCKRTISNFESDEPFMEQKSDTPQNGTRLVPLTDGEIVVLKGLLKKLLDADCYEKGQIPF
jgi:ssDNA-binding Zn-finger/Zn-ribbon topoisomerase 1